MNEDKVRKAAEVANELAAKSVTYQLNAWEHIFHAMLQERYEDSHANRVSPDASFAAGISAAAEVADERLEGLRAQLDGTEPKQSRLSEVMGVLFGVARDIRALAGGQP